MRPWVWTSLFLLGMLVVSAALRRGTWTAPASAAPYLAAIDAAEKANRLPPRLLARLLYQESRYRPDVIDGRKRSDAGAVGIAQIIPRWHPSLDGTPEFDANLDEQAALDPKRAIPYAGSLLRRYYDRFKDWELALAAYNWGEGNVNKAQREGRSRLTWPAETQVYVTEIAWDVGL